MTRYQRLRRANTAGDLDRATWAGLDKIKFESIVRGSGEFLVDPIYFGQAFDSPPFFTYSAVAGPGSATFPEVKAIGWPSVHASSGRDELLNLGWLSDGSFEHQMIWNDPYIPDVKEHLVWPGFQKILSEQGPGGGWQVPDADNFWVQSTAETSPSQPRWEISNERAASSRAGYQGSFSARYIFDDGGRTRWLVPLYAMSGSSVPFIGFSASDPDDRHLNDIVSLTSDVVAENWGLPGGRRPIAFNPPLDRWTIDFKVYCTAVMTFEFVARQWESPFVDGAHVYRLIKEDLHFQEIPADEWTNISFAYTASEFWPNWPIAPESELDDNHIMHTLLSRLTGGSSGDKVFIDECYLWPNMTTSGGLPLITIGVAEWIQDQGGLYIGAKLWVKVGGSEVIA